MLHDLLGQLPAFAHGLLSGTGHLAAAAWDQVTAAAHWLLSEAGRLGAAARVQAAAWAHWLVSEGRQLYDAASLGLAALARRVLSWAGRLHDAALRHDVAGQLAGLAQVLLIDITLAGDNAVVIGLAVARLPPARRRRAMLIGIALATAMRIALALVTLQLLAVIGLTFAGGLLLLWVCARMVRELRHPEQEGTSAQAAGSIGRAILQIVLADASMSLDNVLAVAGVARDRVWVLVAGLTLSVVLTGVAAGLLLRLLDRTRWIAWVGLAIVAYVALSMIRDGWGEVGHWLAGLRGSWG